MSIEAALGEDADSRKHGETLATFYAERQHEPVWITDGRLNDDARAVMARIGRATEDGLDPEAYRLPDADLDDAGIPAPDVLADAELTLSIAVIDYARHAQSGRIDPSKVSVLITMKPERPDPLASLKTVADAEDRVAALEGFNPSHEQFRRLRTKLAELRKNKDKTVTPVKIPTGRPNFKLGMTEERVSLLKERLGLPLGEVPDLFDEPLHKAVQAFQRSRGLRSGGIVGPKTIGALNAPPRDRIGDVLINMERWRWMPRDLGKRHVSVSIPDYMVRVSFDLEVIYSGRVVVGTRENQTPVFSNEISSIAVNPYWNVPRSILLNEMMPKIRRDPGALARRGYQFISRSGRVINPYSINWYRVSPNNLPFRIRQTPGKGNALGRVKFMFPNEHSVYLHDTPARSLFSRSKRAFSHGCVRLHEPFKFADALLGGEADLDARKLKGMVGGREKWEKLQTPVPVHITYFTTRVNEAGKIEQFADIYGHDRKLRSLMGLEVREPLVASGSKSQRSASARSDDRQEARSSRRSRREARRGATGSVSARRERRRWEARRRREARRRWEARRRVPLWSLPRFNTDSFYMR